MFWGRVISGSALAAGVIGAMLALEQHQAAGVLERDMSEYLVRYNRQIREALERRQAEALLGDAEKIRQRADRISQRVGPVTIKPVPR